jgi:hypothetical protein
MLKVEAAIFYQTLVPLYQTERSHISEDHNSENKMEGKQKRRKQIYKNNNEEKL